LRPLVVPALIDAVPKAFAIRSTLRSKIAEPAGWRGIKYAPAVRSVLAPGHEESEPDDGYSKTTNRRYEFETFG
jgi:hypothetical protein